MIFWHMGFATATVYVTLGRRRIDFRMIALGAVLPDVIDLGQKKIAHTLLAAVVVTVAIVILTRGERRLSLFGIGVGWLLHLVGDAMWEIPETFLWPAFGTGFGDTTGDYGLSFWLILGEVVGLLILWWFWVAFELSKDDRFPRFLRDGHLRA
jgi:hypothetical protein